MAILPPQRTAQNKRPVLSEINVTPFVDVMLVLLIIFMVTAPLMTAGVSVDLPQAKTPTLSDNVDPITVSVDKVGQIFIEENPLELEQLIPRLTAITGANPEVRIYIRGDQKLNYGRVIQVIGAIKDAGFEKVALIAQLPQDAVR